MIELLDWIQQLKGIDVTGGSVVLSWLIRRYRPLQKQHQFGFWYEGLNDPTHFSAEKITNRDALRLVRQVLDGVIILPTLLVQLFQNSRPLEEVGVSLHNQILVSFSV